MHGDVFLCEKPTLKHIQLSVCTTRAHSRRLWDVSGRWGKSWDPYRVVVLQSKIVMSHLCNSTCSLNIVLCMIMSDSVWVCILACFHAFASVFYSLMVLPLWGHILLSLHLNCYMTLTIAQTHKTRHLASQPRPYCYYIGPRRISNTSQHTFDQITQVRPSLLDTELRLETSNRIGTRPIIGLGRDYNRFGSRPIISLDRDDNIGLDRDYNRFGSKP